MKPHASAPQLLALILTVAAVTLSPVTAVQKQPGRSSPALRFRTQEIAKDFGVGYAVVPGDVNGDKRMDILAISGTELVWFQAPELGEDRDPGRRRDDRRQRHARAARHRRRRAARRRARRGLDRAEHRHAAVGQAERPGHDAGVGGVPDLRRADPASHQVGRCRRRQEARARSPRRCTAREPKGRPGWPGRAPAGVQAAGESES